MSDLHDFRKLVELCIETAECFYGISLNTPNISFNLKGRSAGEASFQYGVYTLKFNPEAVRNHWEEMVKNTISHEVAHIVQHKMRGYMSHDSEWKSIDRNLGGNGQRCHKFDLTPAKRKLVTRYKYVLPSGMELLLGPKHHKIIQSYNSWSPITVRKTREMVTKNFFKEAVVVR